MAQVELERKISETDLQEVNNRLEHRLSSECRLGLSNSSKTDVPTDYDTDSAPIRGESDDNKDESSYGTNEDTIDPKYLSINDYPEEVPGSSSFPVAYRGTSWTTQKLGKVQQKSERENTNVKTQNVRQVKQRQFRQKYEQQTIFVESQRARIEHEQQVDTRRELVRANREICRLESAVQQKELALKRLNEANRRLEGDKQTLMGQVSQLHKITVAGNVNLTKKTVSERERTLLRKATTLSSQVTRLEKQCKNLRLENDRIRKQMELSRERSRGMREKARDEKLARRNTELVASTRQLQEKVRMLQKEMTKQSRLEKTIQTLKKELQQSKERQNHELNQKTHPQNESVITENASVEQLLRVATRERLQLEYQLSTLTQNLQRETTKFLSLQESNNTLHHEYESLKENFNHVEDLLEEKRQHCEDLRQRLSEKSEICSDLETQLNCVLGKNTELAILNSDLEKQLQEIKNVNDSSRELRTTLGFIDTNRPLANLELEGFHVKVEGLDMVLRQMHEASEKQKELEQEQKEVLHQLQQHQEEVKKLDKSQDSERNKKLEIIENLQSKLRELEKKCELQNVRQEELILEMAAIKRSQAKSCDWTGSPQPINQEVQTSPDNGLPLRSSQLNANIAPSGIKDIVCTSEYVHSSSVSTVDNQPNTLYSHAGHTDGINSSLVTPTIGLTTSTPILMNNANKNPSYLSSSNYPHLSTTMSPSNSIYTRTVSPLPSMRSSSPAPSFGRSTSPLPAGTSAQIDRIMAKIEQDNKILAELDRTRATIGLSSSILSNTAVANLYGSKSYASLMDSTTYPSYQTSLGHLPSVTQTAGVSSTTVHSATTSAIPTIITTACEGGNIANASHVPAVGPPSGTIENDNPMDYLEIPGRGRVQVFIARYSYDPLQHSPNENPEAELAVNAGEYIYVVGGMDEDGFYDGELMNGKRGLVPSNFVERLRGEDLLEFQRSILLGIHDADEETIGMGQELNFTTNNDSQLLIEEYRKAIDQSYLELWDMEDEEDELHAAEHSQEGGDTFFSVLVPAPQKLTLERQLHKSILISWSPSDAPENSIESYVVYVDGLLKMTVKASDRTRALVEGVDSSMPHRISVRSVTPNKRTSRDAACTMVIGRDVPVAPSCVRATNVTATSAVISWLPSNSNYQHSVCVNNVEVRVVKPGVYRHTISGLTPNTTYRVSVRVKNIKLPMAEDKPAKKLEMISSFVDFKTLQVGLPDPPLDIQVEAGPQDGTLLITWLPVTINESGTSNGAPVTGYAVYADGKKVIDIDSPTGDHALLNIAHLQGVLPKAVTVRTKSHDSLSPDSMLTKVPPDLIKGSRMKHKMAKSIIEDLGGSSAGSELSDIAEEAEDDLSDIEESKESMKDDMRDRGRDQGRDHRDHRPPPRGSEPKDGHDKMMSRRPEGSRGRDDRGLDRGRDQRNMQPSRGPRDYPPGDPRSGRDLRSPRGPYDEKLAHGHVDPRRREAPRSHRHYNSHGQIIIEPEENLSDKEIYPPSHMTIPSIEITKDSASEGRNSVDVCSDEEYEIGRNGMPSSGKHGPYSDYGRDKSRPSQAIDRTQSSRDREYYDREWNHRRTADSYGHDYSSRRKGVTHDETQRPRLFRAIFDYDPRTMSPNPNAADEELPFREGQIIKIFGEMDPDGFYWGEANGKKGYVPGNMVTELPMDQNAVDQRHSTSNRRTGERWNESYTNLPKRKMVALYDYDPQELSPNVDAEAELSFSTGDVIYVYGEMDEDGFFLGELNGLRGLVPSNFLMEAPADYRETPRRETLLPHDASSSGGKYQRKKANMDRAGVAPNDGRRTPINTTMSYEESYNDWDSYRQHSKTKRTVVNRSHAGGNSSTASERKQMLTVSNEMSFLNQDQKNQQDVDSFVPSEKTIADSMEKPQEKNLESSEPSRGLLSTMSSLTTKLSPLESTTRWDQTNNSKTDAYNKQNLPTESGAGFFQTLLNFAKRAT